MLDYLEFHMITDPDYNPFHEPPPTNSFLVAVLALAVIIGLALAALL